MTKFSWELLQQEGRLWTEKNFPGQQAHHPVLGLIEEIGELVQADALYNADDTRDALGDIMVYAANVCNYALDADLREIMANAQKEVNLLCRIMTPEYHSERRTLKLIGLLSHSVLKMQQNIRGSKETHQHRGAEILTEIMEGVLIFCVQRNWSLLAITENIWEKVKQRDWSKDRNTGGQPRA